MKVPLFLILSSLVLSVENCVGNRFVRRDNDVVDTANGEIR